MSDILIKGMEMPNNCYDCPFIRASYAGDYYCAKGNSTEEDLKKVYGQRMADCPLIEIPTPHGRLIYEPCVRCSKCYKNRYQPKKKDDEINVGDEVDWSGDKFIVTRIFQPYDKAEECDGVDMDGCTYHDVLISGLTKTGRHVDIASILEDMRE